jgi:hypothetical protein
MTMSEHFFGLHSGHLTAKADKIAAKHGAWHTNHTEPRGERRGWFSCPNRGWPHDDQTAKAVLAEIDAMGGMEALTHKRDLSQSDAA